MSLDKLRFNKSKQQSLRQRYLNKNSKETSREELKFVNVYL